jgi:hypothetical protein
MKKSNALEIYDYERQGSNYPIRIELFPKDAKKYAVVISAVVNEVVHTTNKYDHAEQIREKVQRLNPGNILVYLYQQIEE